jgi:hypothetical protein
MKARVSHTELELGDRKRTLPRLQSFASFPTSTVAWELSVIYTMR